MSITPVTPDRATFVVRSSHASPAQRHFFPSSPPAHTPPAAPLKGRVCPGKPVKAAAPEQCPPSPAAVDFDQSAEAPSPQGIATPAAAAAPKSSAAIIVVDSADEALPEGIDFSSLSSGPSTPPAAAIAADCADDALPDGIDFSSLSEGISAAPVAAAPAPNHMALIDLHRALLNGASIGPYTLKPLAKGSFMQVFSTNEDPSFVVKVFLIDHLKSTFANANRLYNLLSHAHEQYLLCEQQGIPTATILNDPRESYLIQMEFVPGTLKDDLASWAHPEGAQTPPKRVVDLPAAVQNRLNQIVAIVAKGAAGASAGLYPDFGPSNFGIRADGQVVLIDHREERLDMSDDPMKDFAGELRTAVNALSQGNPHIRALFMNAILISAPTIHQHILALDAM